MRTVQIIRTETGEFKFIDSERGEYSAATIFSLSTENNELIVELSKRKYQYPLAAITTINKGVKKENYTDIESLRNEIGINKTDKDKGMGLLLN